MRRQRGPSNFEVMEITGVETDISHGVFDTIDEARGCVEYDKLTAWEIWQGDHIVEHSPEEVIGGPGWRDGKPPAPFGTVSDVANRLIAWVSDAAFECGEWDSDDENHTYEELHGESEKAKTALREFIADLEVRATAVPLFRYEADGAINVSDDEGVLGALNSQYEPEHEAPSVDAMGHA